MPHNSLNVGGNRHQLLKQKSKGTLFRVFSFRKGRITVYRAWIYQGWLTKWIPPNLAGKLSWSNIKVEKSIQTHLHWNSPGNIACCFIVWILYVKEKGTSFVTERISEESPTVCNQVNPSQEQVSERNFNIFQIDI